MPLKKIERNVHETVEEWEIPNINELISRADGSCSEIKTYKFSSKFGDQVSEWRVELGFWHSQFPSRTHLAVVPVSGVGNFTCNIYLVDIDKNLFFLGRKNRKVDDNMMFYNSKTNGYFFSRKRLPRKIEELLPNNTMTLHIQLLTYLDDNPIFPLESINFTDVLDDDLPGSYLELYITKKKCDVIIKVGDIEFKVHGFVLEKRCRELYNQVTRYQQTPENNNNDKLTLTGIDPKIFERVLEFIYTGKVNKLDDHSEYLLPLAHRYQLKRLKRMCEISIGYHYLTYENSEEIRDLAIECEAQQLRNAVAEIQRSVDMTFGSGGVVILKRGYKTRAFNKYIINGVSTTSRLKIE